MAQRLLKILVLNLKLMKIPCWISDKVRHCTVFCNFLILIFFQIEQNLFWWHIQCLFWVLWGWFGKADVSLLIFCVQKVELAALPFFFSKLLIWHLTIWLSIYHVLCHQGHHQRLWLICQDWPLFLPCLFHLGWWWQWKISLNPYEMKDFVKNSNQDL